MSDYIKKHKLIKLLKEINKYSNESSYERKIDSINEYLNIVPEDEKIRLFKVRLLIENLEYDLAIEELKIVLKFSPNNKYAIKNLFLLYYYQRMYKEAYDMLADAHKCGEFSCNGLKLIEIFIKKKLGLKINIKKSYYIIEQILNYDENKAIKHINEHKYIEGLDSYNNSLFFNKRIDMIKLINIVKENIKESKRASKFDICDVYYFSIQNIGYDNINIYNTLKVVVLPETDNIITMYPFEEVNPKDLNYLDMKGINIYTNLLNNNSQIKKFNRKYNK